MESNGQLDLSSIGNRSQRLQNMTQKIEGLGNKSESNFGELSNHTIVQNKPSHDQKQAAQQLIYQAFGYDIYQVTERSDDSAPREIMVEEYKHTQNNMFQESYIPNQADTSTSVIMPYNVDVDEASIFEKHRKFDLSNQSFENESVKSERKQEEFLESVEVEPVKTLEKVGVNPV